MNESFRFFILYITSPLALKIYCGLIVFLSIANALLKRKSDTAIRQTAYTETVNLRQKQRSSMIFWITELSLFAVFVFLCVLLWFPHTVLIVEPGLPLFEPLEVSDTSPLVISFDRPFFGDIDLTIEPPVPGQTELIRPSLRPFMITSILFTPETTLEPSTQYIVEISPKPSTKSNFPLLYGPHQMFLFTTPDLPGIESISPGDGDSDIPIDTALTVTFSREITDNAEWTYSLVPHTDIGVTYSTEGNTASIRPQTDLAPGAIYTLSVARTPVVFDYASRSIRKRYEPETVKTITFTTSESSTVRAVEPSGSSILPPSPLLIRFQEDMDTAITQKAVSITPETDGSFWWDDRQTLVFMPRGGWQTDTAYTVLLKNEARTNRGGTLADAMSFSFRTIKGVAVHTTYPVARQTNVPVTAAFTFTFNQPVDQKSAYEGVSLFPSVPLKPSWTDTTLTLQPLQPLSYGSTYELLISEGITGLYGSPSSSETRISFKTAPYEFSLPISLYRQSHRFTCFSSAVKMALSYYGHTIDEVGFLDEIGYQTVRRDFVSNTWGDPNAGVVGTIDGSGEGGYGAHWEPVARAIRAYRPVEVKTNWTIAELLDEVIQNHPVIVWWVNGSWPVYDVSRNLPGGGRVYTVNGMHASVVTGWRGDRSNPERIFVNDPAFGKRSLTQQQFLSLWKWFGNTALIIL